MWFINGKTQHGYLLGKMSYVCDRFLEMGHLRAYLDPSLHEKQYGHQGRIRLQNRFPAADPFEPQSRLQDVSMGHERRIIKRDLVKI